MTPVVVDALTFGWPGQPPLFRGASFTLPAGVAWLGGDDGAGKTTLLRLLAGALPAQAGVVRVQGDVFWVDPRADGCDAHWFALGRQPAEGGAGQVARHAAQGDDL